jgi:molybdopterin-guanine dinucleotide biosynthesis protein A
LQESPESTPTPTQLPEPTQPVAGGAVLLLAADLPFFDRGTAEALVDALADPHPDAAVLVDADGREQPLAAAYRVGPLRAALAELLATSGGDPSGLPLRRLVGGLATARLADRSGAALDCDTWEDLEQARRREQQRTGAAGSSGAGDSPGSC